VSYSAIQQNLISERDSVGYCASIDVLVWGIGKVCGGWQRPSWLGC
jgi:hypothetical protein